MNIPLDNLYHWVAGLAQHPVILYVFRPHGSKDIFDLTPLNQICDEFDLKEFMIPNIVCHDQEPLDYASHVWDHDLERISAWYLRCRYAGKINKQIGPINELKILSCFLTDPVLNCGFTYLGINHTDCDWTILLHSELNSDDVEDFSHKKFLPVYYWCHAVLARDWYRFAQYDVRLHQKNITKTFLVYCRDWTPVREYRLKFLDLLLDAGLLDECRISTQHTNSQGVHLKDYHIQDPRFVVDTARLLSIPDNNSPSTSSADYDTDDFTSTAISVVLETVVDSKIHLTEKTLRAIACGHAFVLVAGPESLAYLRRYGFCTFGTVFDESYDTEKDTVTRLEKVIATMQQIKNLSAADWQEINEITAHNRSRFFSEDFANQVRDELKSNLAPVVEFCMNNRGNLWWETRKMAKRQNLYKHLSHNIRTKNSIMELRKQRLSRNRSGPIITE
jgi:hypothetical protein